MKLPAWLRRGRRDAELDEEIRAHLEMAIRDRMARGESREEAEYAARREFGNVPLVREVTRDMWGGGPTARAAPRRTLKNGGHLHR